MGLADLHVHSTYSWDGTASVDEILEHAAHHAGLDVIAITDHDELRGGLEGRERARRAGLEVIPGMEVTSADGHVLALFIERPIPAGRTLEATLELVGEQGGLCIAPHPMARWTPSLSEDVLRRALADRDLARVLVGIEVWNAGLVRRGSNLRARALAETLPVAHVGDSDSHLAWSIGFAATRFPGHTAAHLRSALESHVTEAVLRQRTLAAAYIARWTFRKASMALAGRSLPSSAAA
jgi:predicted metal-dependent phosphoesterase TrpH